MKESTNMNIESSDFNQGQSTRKYALVCSNFSRLPKNNEPGNKTLARGSKMERENSYTTSNLKLESNDSMQKSVNEYSLSSMSQFNDELNYFKISLNNSFNSPSDQKCIIKGDTLRQQSSVIDEFLGLRAELQNSQKDFIAKFGKKGSLVEQPQTPSTLKPQIYKSNFEMMKNRYCNDAANENKGAAALPAKSSTTSKVKVVESRILIKFKPLVYDSLSDDEGHAYLENDYTFSPESSWMYYFHVYLLLACLYCSLVTPVTMGFHLHITTLAVIRDIIVDLSLIFKLLINFNTGFYDDQDNFVSNRKKIRSNYLNDSFLFDLISTIPINSFMNIQDYFIHYHENSMNNTSTFFLFESSKQLNYLRVIRSSILFKIISSNVIHAEKGLGKLLSKVGLFEGSAKIFLFVMKLFILLHITSCVWIDMAYCSRKNWIIHIGMENSTYLDIYLSAFYFVLSTIFTIGYGDIVSINYNERLFNSILMVFGIFMYTLAISSLSNVVYKQGENEKRLEVYFNTIDDFQVKFNLQPTYTIKVKAFLKSKLLATNEDISHLLRNLPLSIRRDMIFTVYKEEISKFKFLKKILNKDILLQILLNLKAFRSFRQEVLIEENDQLDEVIFLRQGRISLEKSVLISDLLNFGNDCKQRNNSFYKPSSYQKIKEENTINGVIRVKIFQLRSYDMFGDNLILEEKVSPVSLVVRTKIAELYTLSKIDLTNIILTFKDQLAGCFYASIHNLEVLNDLIESKLLKKRELIISYIRGPHESLFEKSFGKDTLDKSDFKILRSQVNHDNQKSLVTQKSLSSIYAEPKYKSYISIKDSPKLVNRTLKSYNSEEEKNHKIREFSVEDSNPTSLKNLSFKNLNSIKNTKNSSFQTNKEKPIKQSASKTSSKSSKKIKQQGTQNQQVISNVIGLKFNSPKFNVNYAGPIVSKKFPEERISSMIKVQKYEDTPGFNIKQNVNPPSKRLYLDDTFSRSRMKCSILQNLIGIKKDLLLKEVNSKKARAKKHSKIQKKKNNHKANKIPALIKKQRRKIESLKAKLLNKSMIMTGNQYLTIHKVISFTLNIEGMRVQNNNFKSAEKLKSFNNRPSKPDLSLRQNYSSNNIIQIDKSFKQQATKSFKCTTSNYFISPEKSKQSRSQNKLSESSVIVTNFHCDTPKSSGPSLIKESIQTGSPVLSFSNTRPNNLEDEITKKDAHISRISKHIQEKEIRHNPQAFIENFFKLQNLK